MPLSGTVCRPSAGTIATINLFTKYEVSMFILTRLYEDMKDDENAKIGVALGLGVS